MKSLKSQNYYEILGVARSASPVEIRNAYEVAKHAFQENSLATYSLFTDEENQEILALISRAYETLFNPELRREYEGFLESLEREGGSPREVRPPLAARMQALRVPAGPPRARPGGALKPPPPRPPRDVPREPMREPARDVRADAAREGNREGGRDGLREAPREPPRETLRESPREAAPEPAREAHRDAPAEAPREVPPERRPPPERHDEAAEKYIQTVSCFTGQVLKKIRQMRGLSLEDIAERTKIRKTYIEYLEEEQFTFLPAPVYVKGFVIMIAGMLDLPPQRVAEDYMTQYRGNRPV